jgi:hypothetical protein
MVFGRDRWNVGLFNSIAQVFPPRLISLALDAGK